MLVFKYIMVETNKIYKCVKPFNNIFIENHIPIQFETTKIYNHKYIHQDIQKCVTFILYKILKPTNYTFEIYITMKIYNLKLRNYINDN